MGEHACGEISTVGSEYHFVSRWQVEGTVEEVAAILRDAASLPRWWPAVYLDVRVRRPTKPDGTGGVVSLLTKGWLPYRLRWHFTVIESRAPHTWTIAAWGDFVGRGTWTLSQTGPDVDVVYAWRFRADKPLLRHGSRLLRPVFSANHRWAMAVGETSLRLELRRCRAALNGGPVEAVPPPPGPTFPDSLRPHLRRWLGRR